MSTKEEYLQQIKYLRENPHKVYETWMNEGENPNSLFAFIAIDPKNSQPYTGCLTMIRDPYITCVSEFGDEHTKQIKNDERIPFPALNTDNSSKFATDILNSLEVFMEYQLDAQERRKSLAI